MTQATDTVVAGDWIEVTVHRKHPAAQNIAYLELRRTDGGDLPPFEAGAHIDLVLPGDIVRQYSLCNDPAQRDRYALGVLLEASGRGGSRAVHEQVCEGDVLRIGRPRNLFPLVEGRHAILLAGGIGVTPILAMAEALNREDRSFELHYCGRSADRMAFRDRITDAPYAVRSRFYTDDAPPLERFDAQGVLPTADPGVHAYVCGPAGFIDHVVGTLRAKGWCDDNIHFESFSAPAPAVDGAAFEIQLGIDGPLVAVKPDQSVAQALIAAGVDVPLSCEQGICGTCAMRVLDGTPDHHDMYFTEAEKAANDQFTPCCSRSLSPRLVVDVPR